MIKEEGIIAGRNPVLEALKSGIEINKIIISDNEKQGIMKEIIGRAREKGIPVEMANKKKLDSITELNHQGVVAMSSPVKYMNIDDIFDYANKRGEDPLLVVLDGIQDPANLGSIIRTSEVLGAHGVIIPMHRSAGITAAVSRISAGAVYHQRIARVANISQAIKEMKERGLWVAACDMNGEIYYGKDLTGPIALVIGGEGKGVSRLVRENCDYVISIPMYGKIGSLNANVAAAIVMSEVVRQRCMKNGRISDSRRL
ncbi:23S rRNA (guanosine(2251)-2'-O)-methyltransferase RlmB [Calorimonas adulescens]|uniref:23S rRNA (Guanosine(2251)-2'-O)-methyltransferase RlmB n=1 Tax=Calorimonas adulescens TaxID=2606906 RepID=A0A5D8QHD8_9THEO|nr:23S rRNA (guanosine(2251)-2'-O)-methyltransferase RlmB [Calorimonas adulescens]